MHCLARPPFIVGPGRVSLWACVCMRTNAFVTWWACVQVHNGRIRRQENQDQERPIEKKTIFFLKKDKTVTMQTLVSESIVVFFSFEQ